jgi:hypothetical protein
VSIPSSAGEPAELAPVGGGEPGDR